jgi:predicted nucleic acid-binding protein
MASANSASILVDTGPLVAFLREAESSHRWAAAKFSELPAPFLTCEPVLAEVFFLVSRHAGGARRFFDLLSSGLLEVDFSVLGEREALRKLVQKYEDLPMSLADACLVRLAELTPGASVFTLDSHFRIYRKNGRQAIPVVMP